MNTTHGTQSHTGPIIVTAAIAAAVTVVAMFLVFVITGIGQDPLQYVHTPAEYFDILRREPSILRMAIGLDNLFIVAYGTLFAALGVSLWRSSAMRGVLATSLALLATSTFLDLVENMHFFAMISAAAQGAQIGSGEIHLQVTESLIKFHVSYLGLFLLGLTLRAETGPERLLRGLLLWFQVPVGMLIYIVPAVALPLVLTRFSFFFVALLLFAWIFRRSGFGSDAPV